VDEAFSNLVREIRKYNKVRSCFFYYLWASCPLVSSLVLTRPYQMPRNNKLAVQSSPMGLVPRVRIVTLMGWTKEV
jgi:hypothetical protein